MIFYDYYMSVHFTAIVKFLCNSLIMRYGYPEGV